ncbi:unnamed protein product, partial [Effrenium voratum]
LQNLLDLLLRAWSPDGRVPCSGPMAADSATGIPRVQHVEVPAGLQGRRGRGRRRRLRPAAAAQPGGAPRGGAPLRALRGLLRHRAPAHGPPRAGAGTGCGGAPDAGLGQDAGSSGGAGAALGGPRLDGFGLDAGPGEPG